MALRSILSESAPQPSFSRRRLLRCCVGLVGSLAAVDLLGACGGAAATPASSATSASSATQPAATAAASSAVATTQISAAATGSTTGNVKAATLTLDFWNPASDELGKQILGNLVDKFNKQSSDFQVKDSLIGDDNNYEKYTTAMAGGVPPDAIMTYEYTPLPVWAYNDALLSLDAYAAQMKIDKNDYFPIVWPMIYLNGHLWGFMQEFDSGILTWNRNLLAKNGYDPAKPPKTIDELDDMINKMTQKDSAGAITQLGFLPNGPSGGGDTYWLAAFGGAYYDTLKAEFTITRPENVAALDWVAGWWKKIGPQAVVDDFNKKYSGTDYKSTFTLEKQALSIQGEYRPIKFQKYFPNLDMGAAFLPVKPNAFYGTGIAGGGNVFVIPKGVAHPKESITFIKYMGGPDPVLEWNVQENNLPPVKSVALDPNLAKQAPLMQPWLDMLKLSADENHLVGPITHPAVTEFNKLKGPVVSDIQAGKINASQGLQQLQQQFQPVLDKYKK